MALSKDDAIAIAAGLLLIGGKKALASSTGRRVLSSPEDDGAALVKRANQRRALDWAMVFVEGGADPVSADAFARWAGIESSGNALESSRLGERGLMQAGPQTVEEGGLLPVEWAALINPKTTRAQQAGLAVKYVDWLWRQAQRHLTEPPSSIVDQIWYAKLYHQRPVDVRDGHMHGEAAPMARELAERWAADALAMHRLRAANVVAWGTPAP